MTNVIAHLAFNEKPEFKLKCKGPCKSSESAQISLVMTSIFVSVLVYVITGTFVYVVQAQGLHCVTHCQAPRCYPSCRPECLKPNCSYQCQNPANEKYCGKPYCHMECENAAWGNCTADSCPLCTTRCSEYYNCATNDCEIVCREPQCNWAVRIPWVGIDCPAPVCNVTCEEMPCAGTASIQSSSGGKVLTSGLVLLAFSLALNMY